VPHLTQKDCPSVEAVPQFGQYIGQVSQFIRRNHPGSPLARFFECLRQVYNYVEYASVATRLSAVAATWLSNGAIGSFKDAANREFNSCVKTMPRVRRLAKPPLMKKITQVHDFAMRLATESQALELATAAANRLTDAVGEFQVAARAKLGIVWMPWGRRPYPGTLTTKSPLTLRSVAARGYYIWRHIVLIHRLRALRRPVE